MNPQVDVVVGLACNAKCGFCVQECTRKTVDQFSIEKISTALKFVHGRGVHRLVITGGEPTLDGYAKRTYYTLLVASEIGSWEFKAVYTNGTGLLEDVVRPCMMKAPMPRVGVLAEAGLTDVNLSRHHYSHKEAAVVFGIQIPTAEDIVRAAQMFGVNVRLNCNLMRGCVDTFEQVCTYLLWAKSLGVKDVYFRNLFRFAQSDLYDPREFNTRNVLQFTQNHSVDFESLLEKVYGSNDFVLTKQRLKKNEGHGTETGFLFQNALPVYFADLTIGKERPGAGTYWVVMPNGYLYDAFTSEQHRIDVPLTQAGTLPEGRS